MSKQCKHNMTRNLKEANENKCRLCGKPYMTEDIIKGNRLEQYADKYLAESLRKYY